MADKLFNIGAGPQPLRGLSGFTAQQAAQNRNTPLGSGRLQNGKIGRFMTLLSYEYLGATLLTFVCAKQILPLGDTRFQMVHQGFQLHKAGDQEV